MCVLTVVDVVLISPSSPNPSIPVTGAQLSSGGFGAASGLSGGQEAKGALQRQQIQYPLQHSVLSVQHWDLSEPNGRQDRGQQAAATQGGWS